MKLALLQALVAARLAASMLKFRYKSGLVNGDANLVDELIEDQEPWTDVEDATSTEWIDLELKFTRSRVLFTDPCRNDPISLVAAFGHALALERLLDTGRFAPNSSGCFALKSASTAGHFECVRLLLDMINGEDELYLGKALGHAAFMGHLEIVRLLVNDGRCASEKNYQSALLYACRAGHVKTAEFLLASMQALGFDRDSFTAALQEAAKNFHWDVVSELLHDGRIDPTASNFFILRQAIKGNNFEMVKILIEFGPVDYWKDGLLFRLAIKKDRDKILEYLLQTYTLETEAVHKLFRLACSMGSYHCTTLLLKNSAIPNEQVTSHATTITVDFNDQTRSVIVSMNHLIKALHEAASNEHEFIIRRLIKDGRFDEGIPDIIYQAFRYGRYEIGRLLLAHPAVSAFWIDNYADFLDHGIIIKACKLDAIECINSLLVPITMDDLEMLLRCSISHGNTNSFAVFLSVLNSRFEEITGETAAKWLETLDYCAMFVIRDWNTEMALAILNLLGVPLGCFLDHEGQERDLNVAIRFMQGEDLSHLQKLLEMYIRHLALMTIMDEYGLKDLWKQIITHQFHFLFGEAHLNLKLI